MVPRNQGERTFSSSSRYSFPKIETPGIRKLRQLEKIKGNDCVIKCTAAPATAAISKAAEHLPLVEIALCLMRLDHAVDSRERTNWILDARRATESGLLCVRMSLLNLN
jgi:hypothetical protein